MKYFKYLLPFSSLLSITNLFLSIYIYNTRGCLLNEGVAFGINVKHIVWISILFLLSLLFLAKKLNRPFNSLFLSLSILGSSNLLVRILLKGVCDYIHILNLSVNIADIGIVTVSILAILYILFKKG